MFSQSVRNVLRFPDSEQSTGGELSAPPRLKPTTVSIPRPLSAEPRAQIAASPEIHDLLRYMVEGEYSDLFVRAGYPPMYNINGEVVPIPGLSSYRLTPEDVAKAIGSISSEENQVSARTTGRADYALSLTLPEHVEASRFRVNLGHESGSMMATVRYIPNRIKSMDELALPGGLRNLIELKEGLILVTGPTGSGKTTTLASLIDHLCATKPIHIITIEDPVEYVYSRRKRALITQQEVGTDIPTFADGVRNALRQKPNVILVGELRDAETMRAALAAAETGHLVLATLHTPSAAASVDRFVGEFDSRERDGVRFKLATLLRGVVSQVLVPRSDAPSRTGAFEVLINDPLNSAAVSKFIKSGETIRLHNEIQTGGALDMVLMDDYLRELHANEVISRETCIEFARNRTEMVARLAEN